MEEYHSRKILLYFIPRSKIQPALVDMQSGSAWVKSCDYLKDGDTFAVLVVFAYSYPYLEQKFKEWEQK